MNPFGQGLCPPPKGPRKKTPKAATGKVVQRLSPLVFCCALGPRFRDKGARVQCVGRKGHPGLCRCSEFSAWDRKDPLVWVTTETRKAASE